MKKIVITTLLISAFALGLSAQKIFPEQVPSVIINKFNHDYPKARDIEWELKGNNYEVEFELGLADKDYEILYSPSGEVLRIEQEISASDLPEVVNQKVMTEFPGHRMKDVKKIVEEGRTVYKLEAKSNRTEWELVVDEKGNIIHKMQD